MSKTKKEKKELSPVEQLERKIQNQIAYAEREAATENERHAYVMGKINKRMNTYREQLKAIKK